MYYSTLQLIFIIILFTVKDWLALVPPTALAAGVTYMAYRAFCPEGCSPPSSLVNPTILKKNEKVVDTVDVEDISEKAVFCRCWRSKNVSHGKMLTKDFCFFVMHVKM